MNKSALDAWQRAPAQYAKAFKRGDRALGVVIMRIDRAYHVVAFEATLGGDESLTAFFANHSHDIVGETKTMADAQELGDRYGRKWKRTKKPSVLCPCDEIKH